MRYKEKHIEHEAGPFWVLDTGRAYAVMVAGVTYSSCESSYARTPEGLSVAVARCNYLGAKYREEC